jgi:hypothetical protein
MGYLEVLLRCVAALTPGPGCTIQGACAGGFLRGWFLGSAPACEYQGLPPRLGVACSKTPVGNVRTSTLVGHWMSSYGR